LQAEATGRDTETSGRDTETSGWTKSDGLLTLERRCLERPISKKSLLEGLYMRRFAGADFSNRLFKAAKGKKKH
jgi:hypothetical protein